MTITLFDLFTNTPAFVPPRLPLREKIAISFSGGATSGFMLKMLLDHFRTHEPDREVVVTFCNTGLEHPRTLDFVNQCDREFRADVVWLEAVVTHGQRIGIRHKIVTYETASRNGEPFENYIKKHGIPNTMYKQCNSRLKTEVMDHYRSSIGWHFDDYSTAVGIRADEIDRVSAKAMAKGIFYPCADAGITKADVKSWWSQQPFWLDVPEHLGNCFTGDTEFMTSDGVMTLEDAEGEIVDVLTRQGWRPAKVSSFGIQPIVELKVKRGAITKTIKTTADHRWVVSKYHSGDRKIMTQKTTSELRIKDGIPLCWNDLSVFNLDPEGIRHGFSFGDGSLDGKWVRTYVSEAKEEILPYFNNPKLGKKRVIEKMPQHYKTLPTGGETYEYLKGFLAGLIASDGHVWHGGVYISNAIKENVNRISNILDVLGLPHHVNHAVRDTNYKKDATLYTICISPILIPEDMILRSAHKTNRPTRRTNPKAWKVVSVQNTGETQEVFCATVIDGPDEFTLADGILTHNCLTCWKKSLRKLLTIAKETPEAFDFMDRMEKTYALAGGERRDGQPRQPRTFFRENRSAQDILRMAQEPFEPFSDDKFIPFNADLDVGGGCGDSCEIGADED